MANVSITRANKQREAEANQLYNLAAALIGAVAVKAYADVAWTLDVVVWIVGAIVLICGARTRLALLEEETQ